MPAAFHEVLDISVVSLYHYGSKENKAVNVYVTEKHKRERRGTWLTIIFKRSEFLW